MNIGGFRDAVFNLTRDEALVVVGQERTDVEAIEL